jgi:hypothetical protein
MSSSRYFRLLEISKRLESMILQIIDMFDIEREFRTPEPSNASSPTSSLPSLSSSSLNLRDSVNVEIVKAIDSPEIVSPK